MTDTVLSLVDLASEPVAIPGRMLRLRRLTLAPGGVVPWHSHANRPTIIYIVHGSVTEFASNGDVPIVHKAGESNPELHGTRTGGKTPAAIESRTALGGFLPRGSRQAHDVTAKGARTR